MRAVIIAALILAGCREPASPEVARLISDRGCGSCHLIPGVAGARGRTGPPLTHMASQIYVAGVAPNSLEALTRFIDNPRSVDPRSAMPDLDLAPGEAELLARYLREAEG